MLEKFFQRIHFFKGLFMQAKDWEAEQNYHIMKRKLHAKYFHTPGIVPGCLEDLNVSVSSSGDKLTISPGYAIDGDGNDIYLPGPYDLTIPNLLSFNPPCKIYVVIGYDEKKIGMRDDPANKEYSGYAYTSEEPGIIITSEAPDNNTRIELARISLSKDPKKLKNAPDPKNPGEDEINLNSRKIAGIRAAEKHVQLSLSDIGKKIMDTTIQVSTASRRQEETSVLIEKIDITQTPIPPMFMVHVQSMDGAQIQWWISCNTTGNFSEYTLHIKNNSNFASTVMCKVFSIRTGDE